MDGNYRLYGDYRREQLPLTVITICSDITG